MVALQIHGNLSLEDAVLANTAHLHLLLLKLFGFEHIDLLTSQPLLLLHLLQGREHLVQQQLISIG